jgi:hypothetical protein
MREITNRTSLSMGALPAGFASLWYPVEQVSWPRLEGRLMRPLEHIEDDRAATSDLAFASEEGVFARPSTQFLTTVE